MEKMSTGLSQPLSLFAYSINITLSGAEGKLVQNYGSKYFGDGTYPNNWAALIIWVLAEECTTCSRRNIPPMKETTADWWFEALSTLL